MFFVKMFLPFLGVLEREGRGCFRSHGPFSLLPLGPRGPARGASVRPAGWQRARLLWRPRPASDEEAARRPRRPPSVPAAVRQVAL